MLQRAPLLEVAMATAGITSCSSPLASLLERRAPSPSSSGLEGETTSRVTGVGSAAAKLIAPDKAMVADPAYVVTLSPSASALAL